MRYGLSTAATAASGAPRADARIAHYVVGACFAACIAMAAVWAWSWLTSPSYATVATAMAPKDLADAVAALDAAGIAHRIDRQTSAALVPASLAVQAQQVLTDAGLVADDSAHDRKQHTTASRRGPNRALEARIAADVERLLFVKGGVSATAVVRATLNTDARVATQEVYDPDDPVALLERETHVEATATTRDGEVVSRYRRAAGARVNGATRTVTSTRKVSAPVTRLSVAVVVHEARDGNTELPSRRTLKRLIAAAAGVELQRGDSVAVAFAGSR